MIRLVIGILFIGSLNLPVNAGSYNYDVSGYNSDGDYVSGNIDADGSKYGSGTIYDSDGNERDVDFEWTGKGELEATDDDGNTYDLEVD